MEMDQATDPLALFQQWYAEATASELNDPNAMALATATPDGVPAIRMVLLKGYDPSGFTFFTNLESRKGRELAANPKAMLCFHWKSLRRQVFVEGDVAPVAAAEADAYYASRPRISRIGAWASAQSRPLESRAVLEARVAEFNAKFPDDPIPRPPHWSGFKVAPHRFEFWHVRPFRLHDRIEFRLADGAWTRGRLYP